MNEETVKRIGKEAGFWTSEGMCETVNLQMAMRFAQHLLDNQINHELTLHKIIADRDQEIEGLTIERDTLRTFAQWILVSERMPDTGKKVLAYYKNDNGLGRRVRAEWVKAKTVESSRDSDCGEYDDDTDTFYDPEGWYEKIDNWCDYTGVLISHEVTYWIPLPKGPE